MIISNNKFSIKAGTIFGGKTEADECYVKAFVVENANQGELLPKIDCNVKEKSVIITDI